MKTIVFQLLHQAIGFQRLCKNKLQKCLELGLGNDIKFHVKEVEKRRNLTQTGEN